MFISLLDCMLMMRFSLEKKKNIYKKNKLDVRLHHPVRVEDDDVDRLSGSEPLTSFFFFLLFF